MDDDERSPTAGSKKRAKPTIVTQEISVASQKPVAVEGGGGLGVEVEVGAVTCSDEMEDGVGQILEKIDRFTQLVSEMLEAGKTVFKNLNVEFEERLIAIHREQIDKWEEEIRELRLLDASNEEADALLQQARYVLRNV